MKGFIAGYSIYKMFTSRVFWFFVFLSFVFSNIGAVVKSAEDRLNAEICKVETHFKVQVFCIKQKT